jgi:hypothetical protein
MVGVEKVAGSGILVGLPRAIPFHRGQRPLKQPKAVLRPRLLG